jgi:secreted trypsin-like serine protease
MSRHCNRSARLLPCLALAANAWACAEAPTGTIEPMGPSFITYGQPDDGRHPYVGLIIFEDATGPVWRCSGALLSPAVVLTAAHCTEGTTAARIWLDEVVEGNPEYPHAGATSYEGTPHTNPDFCRGCTPSILGYLVRDVGVVVLSEPVPTSVVGDYVELPEAGIVSTLPSMAAVDLVGYGVQERVGGGGQPVWAGLRVRLWAPSQLVPVDSDLRDEVIALTANPGRGKGGFCFGDSGGPDLLAGSDVVIGINSFATNQNCAGVAYSSRVDIPEVLAWVRGFLDAEPPPPDRPPFPF